MRRNNQDGENLKLVLAAPFVFRDRLESIRRGAIEKTGAALTEAKSYYLLLRYHCPSRTTRCSNFLFVRSLTPFDGVSGFWKPHAGPCTIP
jgi:hypothetical protein